jgi:hypothetical protein
MAAEKLEPTVTIGGAPAGYKPATTLQPTASFGGAPAAYAQVPTPNYINPAPPAEPQTRVAANEARKAAGPPYEAPAGSHWQWIGTEYKLYKDSTPSAPAGGGGPSGGGNTGAGASTGSGAATTDMTAADLLKQQQQAERVSAFNILKDEFTKYGLGTLVDKLKQYMTDGTPASEFSLKLQETPEYQARFAANADRIKAGLAALTPAQYVALEDQYQNVMRNYGLPSTYYSKDDIGTQKGFQKLLASDVSAAELEDRIATAQQRVLNTNPEVLQALKQFYPDLNNADILAYTLDPANALTNIKRKVSAAEIGGAALAQGLQAQGGTAESLAGQGITKAQAQQGYTEIAGLLPRASQLSDIYGQGPYNQQTAEAEVFNTSGAAAAAAKRKKLTALETAQFSGSSGVGALGRDKAAYGLTQGQQGLY